ncbi:RNA-binding (RRM/RBD/RNP motifs) family protein [Striga asiatica]|uniref:RNA-binding (RRM/RBD/RNP motifs) family protein n=1 Tax=Striga asiatica TaxID=4170 RepID=A0A5A7P803_STRAF|nr:RNA-binding (RRM/RBD/RNP motifs) family protein [Striga asiatica]
MANLDMALDDLINKNKTSRPAPRQSGPGPARRFPGRSANRAAPYSFGAWDHGMFAAAPTAFPARVGARVSSIETGTKLLISNLHHGVTDEDIEELFSGIGELKSCSIHYDRSGRSEGTAVVVFCRRRDAETAIKRYNNVQLDGMPMRIELVGMNMDPRPMIPPDMHAGYANNQRNPPRVQGRGDAAARRGQGSFRGSRNERVGPIRGRAEKISAEDLDADLEKYLAGAKGTN